MNGECGQMEMESHGSVRIMERQSQHKTSGQSLWQEALSARSELHSHPLAEQAQACGRLTEAEGLEGRMAPVVTTSGYSWEKKTAAINFTCCRVGRRSSPTLGNGGEIANCWNISVCLDHDGSHISGHVVDETQCTMQQSKI